MPVGVGAPETGGHAAISAPRRTSPVAAVTLPSSVVVVVIAALAMPDATAQAAKHASAKMRARCRATDLTGGSLEQFVGAA